MKEDSIIQLFNRNITTKSELKKLRKQDFIPGIIYGGDKENIPIYIKKIDFERLTKKLGGRLKSTIINTNEGATIIKDIQLNLLTNQIQHIDFQRISLKEKIEVNIPIKIFGESIGISKGGVLEQHLRDVKVKCIPGKIPEGINVDITNLDIHQSILLNSVELPKDVEVLTDLNSIIVSILPPVKEEVAPTPPTEAPAEPEVIAKGKKPEVKVEGSG